MVDLGQERRGRSPQCTREVGHRSMHSRVCGRCSGCICQGSLGDPCIKWVVLLW